MNSLSSQLTELQAIQQQTTDLFNAGEIDTYFRLIHEDVIYNIAGEPNPVIGKVAVRAWYDAFLARHEYVYWSSNPQPVIIGTTGILSGPFVVTLKPIGQPEVRLKGQHTIMYALIDGKWMKVGEHNSLSE